MGRESFNRETRAKWMPIFITGVCLITIYIALGNIGIITSAISTFLGVIAPLLLGILFAYFMFVPQKLLERLFSKIKIKKFTFISKSARGISTVFVFLLFILLIVLVISFILPNIIASIVDLANSIPGYIREIENFLNNIPKDSVLADLDIGGFLQDNSSVLIDTVLNAINTADLSQAAGAVGGFFGGIFDFILAIFIALYILLYRDEIREYFLRLNNAVFKNINRRDRVRRYMGQVNEVMRTFIASKGVDALCNFTAASIITTIFGMPYSLLLGLMAGLFNFIPYIGSVISSLIISVLAFLTLPVPMALGTAISIVAFQQLDGNFIEPRIMKTSLKLNPILVIMAVVIGGAYFGLAGMFLGVPISAIIKQLIQEYMISSETIIADDSRR